MDEGEGRPKRERLGKNQLEEAKIVQRGRSVQVEEKGGKKDRKEIRDENEMGRPKRVSVKVYI